MSESTKDFQALLDTIATGVYGKEIRGAIHDALEWLYEISGAKPQKDKYGTFLFKLQKPMTFNGGNYLDTGVKLYENGDADDWCVCIAYSGTPSSTEGLPYILADCGKDGETQGFRVMQSGANEGWTVSGGSGAFRMDLAMEHTGKAWSEIINTDGTNVFILSKEGTNYSFYLNGYKAYNSALGYALDTSAYIPTDVSLIIAARHTSTVSTIDHRTSFTLKDARVYNSAMDDSKVAQISAEMLAL